MKKLNILIALADFLWFITCLPLIPLTLFLSVYMFFNKEILNIIEIEEQNITSTDWSIQMFILLAVAVILISIYAFYLFRKTLRYFRRRNPFDDFVINSYNRIGNLLLFSGIISASLSLIYSIYFSSKVTLSFGWSPYLFLICMGLFFMVLSETFKIAKTAKQENDLTI